MMDRKKMVAFDFDGTLTKKDSFVAFIKFSKGPIHFYSLLPLIVFFWGLSYIGFLSRHKAKEKVFGFFFKGVPLVDFDTDCDEFSGVIDGLLKRNAMTCIHSYLEENYELVIVSASVENWIAPWAVKHHINTTIATQIEVDSHGRLTGKFSSLNCRGEEKVNRFLQVFPSRESYVLDAYGDSDGDVELLSFADHGFWNKIT